MPHIKPHKIHDLLAKLIFIGLPTIYVCYYILLSWNAAVALPTQNVVLQTAYLAVGMVISMLFYALGFRFIPTYILLVVGLYMLYKGLDATAIGEFDTFFITIQFIVFAVLFSLGWLIGWGILRLKKFALVLSITILIVYILLLGQDAIWLQILTKQEMARIIWTKLGPVLLYVFIAIYFSQIIHYTFIEPKKYWVYLLKRTCVMALLLLVLYVIVALTKVIFFEEKLANLAQNRGGEQNSLLQKNTPDKDDPDAKESYSLQNNLSMSGNNQKDNVLLFAAYIDNYFEDNSTPNPLYLVSYYYTKYDTLTESFERDSLTPDQDYFSPQVGTIPMYHSYTDSSVLAFGKQNIDNRTVSFEIYNKNLDPNFFVGPTTSFFVQPIAVEASYKKEFRNAYRAKSVTSVWNSAYFIYNVEEPNIKLFQSIRTKTLKKHEHYDDLDSTFLAYYTAVPATPLFQRIDSLAHIITAPNSSKIEQVLAIKQYFLARDQYGKKIFRYSDNPGEPNLPGASKLEYFLFKNKSGYCAYYATATLYMLRSLGIPSRVVGGFLTEDRSADKNKGWYWYYTDQAHAWVQVYFPGIGWIDFDTTIDNDDARESDQTDGTPPLQPTKATFAAYGVFTKIDTVAKKGDFTLTTAVILDKNIAISPITATVDLSSVLIQKDTNTLTLAALKLMDSVTIVSYNNVFEKISNASASNLKNLLPQPLPIDEIHIPSKVTATNNHTDNQQQNATTLQYIVAILALVATALIVLSIPYLIFLFKKKKLKQTTTQESIKYAYDLERWVLKFFINNPKATDIELFKQADELHQTHFKTHLDAYHAYKYGNVSVEQIPAFKEDVLQQIRHITKVYTWRKRLIKWIQLDRLFK